MKMNRDEIIEAILSLKTEAVAIGFDWPTEEIASVSTEDLYLFLGEVETYLYFEVNGRELDELDMPWF
jgi:gamma-glutamyl-gamma-aminobutyrate hydrolase PuuD